MKRRIAVLGDLGSFSDIAAKEYAGSKELNADIIHYPLIDNVIDSVPREADIAVVPLENSIDGYLQVHMDLILSSELSIIDEWILPIRFDFVANVSDSSQVKTIYAQYATIGQCHEYLKRFPTAKIVVTSSNTDTLAQYLEAPVGSGAIISSHLTEDLISDSIDKDIMDVSNNHTRFVVLRKEESVSDSIGSDEIKASFVLTPNIDYPGLLYEILKAFSRHKINLVSIMSRPTKKKMGSYHFFFELEAKRSDIHLVRETFRLLSEEYPIRVLGIYPKSVL